VKNLQESRVLQRGPGELRVYQVLQLPVLDDRDFTLRVTWGGDEHERWIRFATDEQEGPPPQPGMVRVHLHEGQWLLTPIEGGRRTHAFYRFRLDLGGSVPGWMGRGKAAKAVPGLFEALRKELRSAP
jgi:hypothetical protein